MIQGLEMINHIVLIIVRIYIRSKVNIAPISSFVGKDVAWERHFVQHDDVIKWKHFPRNWTFVRGIHRSRWIPHTKASDAELWCFLWFAFE